MPLSPRARSEDLQLGLTLSTRSFVMLLAADKRICEPRHPGGLPCDVLVQLSHSEFVCSERPIHGNIQPSNVRLPHGKLCHHGRGVALNMQRVRTFQLDTVECIEKEA